jgi:hypothetical protein
MIRVHIIYSNNIPLLQIDLKDKCYWQMEKCSFVIIVTQCFNKSMFPGIAMYFYGQVSVQEHKVHKKNFKRLLINRQGNGV